MLDHEQKSDRLLNILVALLVVVVVSGGWVWSHRQGRDAERLEQKIEAQAKELALVRIELQVMNVRLSELTTEVVRHPTRGE